MRDWKKSKYKKTIGISEENYAFIREKKGKKSLSGFLDIIINNYKKLK